MAMKVPNDAYSVINLDAPTLSAREIKANGGTRWAVWCKHCQVDHLHGPGEGQCEARCADEASHYRKTGYNLVLPDGAVDS
jgi:hypothetical protein